MKKYVCKRNEVMAGNLVLVLPIISNYENSFNGYKSINCRSMLYRLTEEAKAEDLIYTTPTNYEIDGKKVSGNNDMKFYIDLGIELDELLKYLKFNKDLTQDDLNKIFRILLKHKSWLNNHILFNSFENDLLDVYYQLKNLQSISTKPYYGEPSYQLIKKKHN